MIIYGNELAASFKEKMKAEIETLKKGKINDFLCWR